MGAGKISAKVFVGNLNYRTTKEELSAFLGAAGEIVDCFLPTDRETGRPRGFGFVTFASPEQAAACVEQFNGKEMNGRALNINPAEERGRPRSGGGGRDAKPGGRGGPRAPHQEFKRGSRRDEGFSRGAPPRSPSRGAPPPMELEPSEPIFDTSERQYRGDDADEWGKGGGRKKKKGGSRRNLRAKKHEY